MNASKEFNVVIAGGGVAALEAALALRALVDEHVRIELVAPEPHFWYRPLAVAEPFELGEAKHFELSDLAARAGATFTLGELASVDAWLREAHTTAGAVLPFDALLVACGAVPKPAVPGAVTFRGPADTESIRRVLSELAAGEVQRLAFAVPWGAVWSLPAYELALMTAGWLRARDIQDIELSLVTPEDSPLEIFGTEASEAVRVLLEEHGIELYAGVYPTDVVKGRLRLVPDGVVDVDRVVALPRLEGARVDGIPQTRHGFIQVDPHGRVEGLPGVYAAGDITTFPIKQGGIAAQQADAAAEAIAAAAGADVTLTPFRPVLRGLLLTGREPRYLRREVVSSGEMSRVSPEPLWWPPAKIVGRHLAPFLGALTGAEIAPPAGVTVEVELDPKRRERHVERIETAFADDVRRVANVMSGEPLLVAPEDTLGEVAEKMRERDVGSALVTDFGRLIGILTSRDLVRAFAGRVHSSEARVREWMTAEPVAVSPGTTLEAAAFLMAQHGIHHLPVVDGERPIGMVRMRDVVGAVRSLSGIGLGF